MKVAGQMISPGMLERSSFYAIFPNGSPRQFVSFLFSDIGAAEMPPVEGSGEMSPEEESMSFMPIWPAGVKMTYLEPKEALGYQIVWKWNDTERLIILEGYSDAKQPPIVIRKIKLPVVQPSEMARLTGESLLETGGRAQAF
jgi:hypothetical protein